MRKLTAHSNTHRGLFDESPAGPNDDVTIITRRNGRVYEVVTNESMGYCGLCELIIDSNGNTKYIDLMFWQSFEQAEESGLTIRQNGYPSFKSPRWIVSLAADSFEE